MTALAPWSIILGADGTVLAAAGGVPGEWVGARLDACRGVPSDLRASARALLQDRHAPAAQVVPGEPPVQLMAVEALPIRRVPTDLRSLLASTIEPLSLQAKALDVRMKIEIPEPLPMHVALDADKVAWAVATLVGNALRFVRRGSRFFPGGGIVVRAAYDGGSAQITLEVRDDGPGISPDRLAVLRRRDGVGPGVALALKLVEDVVVAHGGRLAIESSTDVVRHGTTVRMTLPVR
jgi:signal transduction histidine kinase